jgi:redox-sensitive bicupin YhaK (pirin superfamily)
MNPGDEPLHFLQIWMLPRQEGIAPGYEQKSFPPADRESRFRLVVSPQGDDGSLSINADVRLYATLLKEGQKAELALPKDRHAWLQVARGSGTFNGLEVKAGDGIAVSAESKLTLTAKEPLEALLFDLA